MSALAEVVEAGGKVWCNGENLRYRLPDGRDDLIEALRAEKRQIVPMLKACEALCRETGGDVLSLAAQIEDAYRRLKGELARRPEIRFTAETLDAESGPALVAVAVRGAGYAVLRVPRENYDACQLLEIVHRIGGKNNA